ncbi:MAG TPA: sigma-54 dependent transcriptional regulator [Vicinamibacteria bacterium]|nr:sigma-54 dependent transcriptional regulator [Vicinamibacteria bacterium]
MIRVSLGVDNPEVGERVGSLLAQQGIEPEIARGLSATAEKVAQGDYDLLLVERVLLGEDPASALAALPEHPAVVVLSEQDLPRDRAELIAAGAHAVLWLGLEDEILSPALFSLAKRKGAPHGGSRSKLDDFASTSASMQKFLRLARRVVKSDSALLILGETGVGKERLARSIHSESARSEGPFVTVNCGALPENLLESELFGHEEGAFTGAVRARRGYFELAHRGTIFLDEIGEMPLHLQVKLLRVLEDKRIQRVGSERSIEADVRIMAATNRDLKKEMEAHRFRADLYYRLAVVTLTVPPLRERREDIAELARGFLDRIRRQLGRPVTGFHPDAFEALLRHDWPGNVRELINVIERAVLLAPGNQIQVSDFRGGETWADRETAPSSPPPLPERLDGRFDRPLEEAREEVSSAFERDYIEHMLRLCRGRVGEAARKSGVNERTLYAMMRRHGLRKEDFRRSSG